MTNQSLSVEITLKNINRVPHAKSTTNGIQCLLQLFNFSSKYLVPIIIQAAAFKNNKMAAVNSATYRLEISGYCFLTERSVIQLSQNAFFIDNIL